MNPSESLARAKRAAVLEEKKRRLLELKARRANRSSNNSLSELSLASSSAAPSGFSNNNNLDEYIDGLLNTAPPGPNVHKTPPNISSPPIAFVRRQVASAAIAAVPPSNLFDDTNAPTKDINHDAIEHDDKKHVETFTVATQTDMDDNDQVFHQGQGDAETKEEIQDSMPEIDNNLESTALVDPSQPHVQEALYTMQFSAFLNSASKKVERLLGAPILSQLFVQDSTRYFELDQDKNTNSTLDGEHSLPTTSTTLHPLLAAHVTFTCPFPWTVQRDITWIDWSCHAKTQDWMLTSYSSRWDTILDGVNRSTPPIRSLNLPPNHPSSTSSSSILPKSSTETTVTDGLVLVWNLTMPHRPEHVFTCASSITVAKFHPTDLYLIIGCTQSGHVVVWDLRHGSRLPVQRSRLFPLQGEDTISATWVHGQGHSIIGMEFLIKESMMVTATSSGQVNFWSLTNLLEPIDTLHVPGAHFSSMALIPESYSIILGDESGTLYLLSSNTNTVNDGISNNINNTAARSSVRSYSTHSHSRWNVKIFHGRATDESSVSAEDTNNKTINSTGHYGMVTAISTKTVPSHHLHGFSKDIPRGVHGLALTCGVDWTWKLWAPAYTINPLMTWMSHSYDYMTQVRWSPVHPSVFATTCCDGTMHLWNLSVSSDEPLTGLEGIVIEPMDASINTSAPRVLNHIQWSLDGRRIAVACADTLHVYGLSDEIWKPRVDEGKRLMNVMVSRGLLEAEG